MTLEIEGVVDRGMHAEEALGRSSRFEALDLALSSSYHLVGVLGPIIFAEPLVVMTGQMEFSERGAIGPQFVGHDQPGCEALLSEQFAHEPQGGALIAPALNQYVEDLALVIDGTPQIHPLAGDPHHHLVEMPAIARPRATPTQPLCDRGTELPHPAPYGFLGDVAPALGQQPLDVAIAQGQAEIEPDRVLNDLGREAMAAVAERSHADILPDTPLAPDPVSVKMPLSRIWPILEPFRVDIDRRSDHPIELD